MTVIVRWEHLQVPILDPVAAIKESSGPPSFWGFMGTADWEETQGRPRTYQGAWILSLLWVFLRCFDAFLIIFMQSKWQLIGFVNMLLCWGRNPPLTRCCFLFIFIYE